MRTRRILLIAVISLATNSPVASQAVTDERPVWIEAECFETVGGWSRDTQHVDVMGSPYLLATGVGRPVEDAVTSVKIPRVGTYRLWVRCRDWLPPHSPGKFRVVIGGHESKVFGSAHDAGDRWQWFVDGDMELKQGMVGVRLRDLTGWWGRVDALVLAPEGFTPEEELEPLGRQRIEYAVVPRQVEGAGSFDVVVVGAGPSGMGAANHTTPEGVYENHLALCSRRF